MVKLKQRSVHYCQIWGAGVHSSPISVIMFLDMGAECYGKDKSGSIQYEVFEKALEMVLIWDTRKMYGNRSCILRMSRP